GMDPLTARTAALRSFGGVEKMKEECRDMRGAHWLENFRHDLRYGIRTLFKDRRFTLLAILALALGIGSATVIFSAIYGVILNTFPFRNADEVTSFGIQDLNHPRGDREVYRFDEFLYFCDHNHVFQDLSGEFGGFTSSPVTYTGKSGTYQFDADYLSVNSFRFFGLSPLLGRLPSEDDVKPGTPPVFVIGDKLWSRQFNRDPNIVGQSFLLNGTPRILVGIMPPRFRWAWVDVWIPFSLNAGESGLDQDVAKQFLYTVGRLKPGVSLKAAAADLDVVAHQYAKIHANLYPKQFTVVTRRLSDQVVGGFKSLIYPLIAAVVLLLLIGCSNVANLLLARATVREKEVAVRSSLGAGRGRLIRQYLAESCVFAAAGCISGCLLAWIGIRLLVPLVPYNAFPQEAVIQLNLPVLLFAVGITAITTMLCGLVPALQALRGDLQPKLIGSGKGSGSGIRHGRLRSALVIAEVALSIVLLVGAGLTMRAFWSTVHVDFGFNPSQVLALQLAFPRGVHHTAQEETQIFQNAFEHIHNLPGVLSASIATSVPPFGGDSSDVDIPGKTHSEDWSSQFDLCSEGYFSTMQLRLLRGRLFSQSDVTSAQRVAVISQAFATKYFGDSNPIGQDISFKLFDEVPELKGALFQIVGVVSDVRNRGPRNSPAPEAYLPYTIIASGRGAIVVRTAMNPDAMVSTIRRTVWDVDSNLAMPTAETIETALQRQVFAFPRFEFAVFAAFAQIGVALIVIGVFSVMAYTVSLQTHEIGIRMALGAQRPDVMKMILRKGLILVVGGIAFGLAASWALKSVIAHLVFGASVSESVLSTFAIVALIVLAVGAAACYLPARRATRVDPLVALRYE
ncbi:MAG TPA: ABC transporter permease, partial [Candidatus Acidoferrales bacterium]|nr:ABC transporter permease [Candidatus Acidoferrales bacterium]